MANIILSWVNRVREAPATLSASVAAGTLPPANLADPRIGKRWRTETLDAWAQADFGSDVACGVFALRFPRDSDFPAGTVQHLLDADGGTPGAGAVDDSGAVSFGLADGYGYHVWRPSVERTLRTWRFQYDGSGVDYIDTGLAWAGPAWSPEINISYDPQDYWNDLSSVTKAKRSGTNFVDEGPRQRVVAFALERLGPVEAAALREMQRIAGISRQVLAIIDPDDAPRETIIGTLRQSTAIRHTHFDIFSKVFEIEESL